MSGESINRNLFIQSKNFPGLRIALTSLVHPISTLFCFCVYDTLACGMIMNVGERPLPIVESNCKKTDRDILI